MNVLKLTNQLSSTWAGSSEEGFYSGHINVSNNYNSIWMAKKET